MSHIETPINPAAMPVGGVPPMRWTAVLHEAFRKLAPRVQLKNPVMFVVYLGSIVTTVLWLQALAGTGDAPAGFIFAVACWLWFTVLFANAAEALAEGRGKAQADALRAARKRVYAKVLDEPKQFGSTSHRVPSDEPRPAASCSSRPATRFPPTAK